MVASSDLRGTVVGTDERILAVGAEGPAAREVMGVDAVFLDAGAAAWRVRERFARDQDLASLLEGTESRRLQGRELEEVSYVLGRDYESLDVFEIEGGAPPLHAGEEPEDATSTLSAILPYFRVRCGGDYGTESMGQGELVANLVLWVLRRVEKNSVVLLEEPESHLCPFSQERLADVIAYYVSQRGLRILISSHSEAILRKAPSSLMRLLIEKDGHVQCVAVHRGDHVLHELGVASVRRGIVLVEDGVAAAFARAWLSTADHPLLRTLAIVPVAGGESVLRSWLKFPAFEGVPRIVGLFDGDQNPRSVEDGPSKEARSKSWPCAYLPGRQAPEIEIRRAFETDTAKAAVACGTGAEVLTRALQKCRGMDHHDWIHEVARETAVDVAALARAAFQVLLSAEDFQAESARCVRSLLDALEM